MEPAGPPVLAHTKFPQVPSSESLLPSPLETAVGAEGKTVDITQEKVREIRAAAADSQELGEETKAKLLEIYDKILGQFKLIDEYKAGIQTYKQMQQTAPASIQETQAALEAPTSEPPTPQTGDMSLAEMEKELASAQKAYD